MAMSDIDNLKSSRRLQARRTAQKLRLQPIDYVEKSVVTQNEWEKIGLSKHINIIDKDCKFQGHKLENERKQFVIEQRRTLKPVFDGSVPPAEETNQAGSQVVETAYPDMESDLLRIVEYYEIHKPNTVKRIHTIKHLDPGAEKQWRIDKHKQHSKHNKSKIGTRPPPPHSTSVTPRIEIHVPTGSQTHRGDLTEQEREELRSKENLPNTSLGFYLATGGQTPDLNASVDSAKNVNMTEDPQHGSLPSESAKGQLDTANDGTTPDQYTADDNTFLVPPAPVTTRTNSLIPLHIVPPSGPVLHQNVTQDKRFQSPPSTKKFRNYKVRTSMSDTGKLALQSRDNSQAQTPIPVKGKSFTPFSDDVRMMRQEDSADVFGSSDADFKAALTESNLKLHAMRTKHSRRTPRPEQRRGLLTPSLASSLENLTIDEFEQVTHNLDPALVQRSPLDVHEENHTILNPFIAHHRPSEPKRHLGTYAYSTMDAHTKAVHETIPENPKRMKPKLFKSKRYGDCYLVPSDVKRTCAGVSFDPYVLAIHKKEIDEIETRKRLEDIKSKLKAQRESSQSIQSNVNEWVKSVDKTTKTKRMKRVDYSQAWSNFT